MPGKDIPILAIGNEELGEELEDTITCPICGEKHLIIFGDKVLEDGSKIPCKDLSFYKCNGTLYLAGINGKEIKR